MGTSITNICINSLLSINTWAGQDRGCSPEGFAENTALGRMVLTSDGNPSHFLFQGLNGNNALYVDSIEFQGNVTNTDLNGNYSAITIQPGMKIYYAQAMIGNSSIAEKLNGKNGGGFCWVSNYAGVYSSTNMIYPDGNTYIFNDALAVSPNLDSDGDGTVNRDDPTPIPTGITFDVTNAGPQSCGGGNNGGNPNGGQGGEDSSGGQSKPGILTFPTQHSGSGGVSFAEAQGTYNGLFYDTNGVAPSTAGFFTAKVNGKGAFSAKLQLGGSTYSFSKAFDANGNFNGFVTSKNLAPLTVTLHLVGNDQITGQVSDSGNTWTAQLLALISVKNASAFGAGKHSLVLSINDASSTTDSGDSFGKMTLAKNGNIQWSGVLPDGSKVSQKSALSENGVWPVYSSLYGGSGTLLGWLQVTNGSSDIGGSAIWIVPANKTSLYPNGLTNSLDATGSSVVTPPAGTQKTIILTGPQLAAPLTNNVILYGKKAQSGNDSMSLSVDAKNGLFNGSVLDPNSGQKLSFQGALLEKSGVGGGFFLNAGKDQGGKVYLAPAN